MYLVYNNFRCTGISVEKRCTNELLTDPQEKRLRPTDVLVYGWVSGKHVCVELIGVSLPCGIGGRGFYCWTGSPQSCFKQNDQI
jgi:hypothetical protein